MAEYIKRKFWQTPWGYGESIAIVVGIVFIGSLLQLTIGSFDFFLLTNPVNVITGLVLIGLSVFIGVRAKTNRFAKWLTSISLSVSLILAMVAMTIIMGLTPQVAASSSSLMALGFDSMTTNWSFVMLYGFTLISLGATIVGRLRRFKLTRDIPFIMQHFGLWLFLAASGLGYADMQRYVMYVNEGETQWRVYDDDGEVIELPIAIKLNDFDMELYSPRLAVVDRATGAVQPLSKPQYYQIDPDVEQSKLGAWTITTHQYIHKAVRGADSTYREVPMPGATPAIHITAESQGKSVTGWVCGGNALQPYMSLSLDENNSIVMTPADPRRYLSDVEVYTRDGAAAEARVEVNSPLWIGSWTIYQYGYDNAAGDMSQYSSFELVYDPWLMPVYVGIILIMLGVAVMVIRGRKRV